MLFLQFRINQDRYVIQASQIVSVIPFLKMRELSGLPDYMTGVISYRGQSVPVVDLSKLLSGRKSKPRLSTRIVLTDYLYNDKRHVILGFVAEEATELVKLKEEDFSSNTITHESTPYLGPIANDSEGMLNKIDINALVGLKIRDYIVADSTADLTARS